MNQKNYSEAITNNHGILKIWRMRSLCIQGKIVVFKNLAIPKVIYVVRLTVISNNITGEVEKKQKYLIWHDSSPNIKH